jgi:hypothetical protein
MIQTSLPAAMRSFDQRADTLLLSSPEAACPRPDSRGYRNWMRGPKFVAYAAVGLAAWSRDVLYLATVGIPMVDESFDAKQTSPA